ncbi:C-type lectin domain family 12 member B-like isoform X1 [Malaclemys terrapin pileata]|uniref:C-type lectin domain family 12 member B-like isoform X1 n=1 Tax=Malaclemys terrapin pileata TaxID=2991368 RepID=UPI0023A854E5|nr:C-type lectin domain family 12 member B-like isoform X1 [Malaclemys terrapin pileata]
MTEEITYADLEFSKSYALENIPKPAAPEEKALHSSSSTWRLVALTFLILCLALLLGMLALGIVFFQVSNDFQKQFGNLMRNQETLQTNFSKRLQDMKDHLCLKGEENNENNGSSCMLCPANWQWMGGDTCFYISTQKRSWEESQRFCSLQNSTFLMLKHRHKLGNNVVTSSQNHVPPRENTQYYWIGLHKSGENSWYWTDGSALLTKKEDWIDLYPSYNCGYLYREKIYNDHCTEKHLWICEKAAVKLRA